MKKVGTVDTVNIVEMVSGEITGLTAFSNDKKGNNLAKILFYDLLTEYDPDLLDKEIEEYVKSGHFSIDGDYEIHSIVATN